MHREYDFIWCQFIMPLVFTENQQWKQSPCLERRCGGFEHLTKEQGEIVWQYRLSFSSCTELTQSLVQVYILYLFSSLCKTLWDFSKRAGPGHMYNMSPAQVKSPCFLASIWAHGKPGLQFPSQAVFSHLPPVHPQDRKLHVDCLTNCRIIQIKTRLVFPPGAPGVRKPISKTSCLLAALSWRGGRALFKGVYCVRAPALHWSNHHSGELTTSRKVWEGRFCRNRSTDATLFCRKRAVSFQHHYFSMTKTG